MYTKFLTDLERGLKVQNDIFSKMVADGWIKVDGDRHSRYDGEYKLQDSATLRVEVKTEIKYGHLPTTYVEYECNSKPSGISNSKADVVINVSKSESFLFSRQCMFEFLLQAKYSTVEDKSKWYWQQGGDNGYSKGLIVNRRFIAETFEWATICKYEEISSQLKDLLIRGII